jgi:hypothetical protein
LEGYNIYKTVRLFAAAAAERYEQPTLPIITYTGGKGAQKAVVYS